MDASRGPGLASGYNSAVERLRETEYPMLNGSIYLDHAGTTLYPKSLVDEFAAEMTSSLLGNPHSASPSSQLSTIRIEDTRLRALQFFNADPADFDLIFVANATAGIKLVGEALRAAPGGFDYAYHQSAHTSLVGVREEARTSICLDDAAVEEWINGKMPLQHEAESVATTLFAYAAQSNMDGRRYPLDWSQRLRNLDRPSGTSCLTILDAAALAPTAPLDLRNSDVAADFTVLSFSKIFGFPDLGALIVRRQAFYNFDFKRYFGGGTVDTVVTNKEQWHAPKTHRLHERLEDGTLPIHSIIALDIAMRIRGKLFGPMSAVASHVSFLTRRLREGLQQLRHHNGMQVCQIYSPDHVSITDPAAGPIIAFNIRNQAGAWISLAEVEKLASLKNFHIRTGGVCNPGGVAYALELEPWEIKRNFSAGFRCGSENDIIAGKPSGVIRVSLGAMSSIADVDAFVAFITDFYCEQTLPDEAPQGISSRPELQPELFVAGITVYPIKSCGGFTVPQDTVWEVRPEGLAWDHSDVEQNNRRKILLSNESPILAINTASLRALNKEIVKNGGTEIPSAVFRANIVLDSPGSTDNNLNLAYAEDNWCKIRIGQQDFKMLGSCRRCHMVCINQDSAEKSQEPFVTLSKTRRFDGKVFFGTHMCHVPQQGQTLANSTRESQYPTLRVGDRVVVD
ncbi:hypothetical protein INS49_008519 [Diaporthe citri]|uniref:uncharacterized protein n=1 Tax=Diaporthe citri TaxID=83186 RepID=UPI001C802F9A|nr:uncharacterized protein INS49_008519 [Diaporthe citri]KAG6363420.1 hypothetical protein INS49_008519 [Diaporthe citri]